MEKIYEYSKETYGVLNHQEIKIDDICQVGYNSVENKPIFKKVIKIHEQRPERGERINESDRRIWAKVDLSIL